MSMINTRGSVVVAAVLVVISGCSKQPATVEPAPVASDERAAATEFNMAPLIDPNTATQAQLAAIPGLSETAVQTVLDQRPFATQAALHAAIGAGMTPADQFNVYSAMFIKMDLNTADAADMMLVPTTMSPKRLAHEFEEYRPYETMDDFRREMQKYVSEQEVAFYERFVTIN